MARGYVRTVPTQDRTPTVQQSIDKVGIEGLTTSIRITRDGEQFTYLATIDISVDLNEYKKGIHMSRLVESINETITQKAGRPKASLETLGAEVLMELTRRHPFKRAEIIISTTLVLKRHTPVSKKPTYEPYDVIAKVIWSEKKLRKYLETSVVGNTLCPHSLEVTRGKAHIQRCELRLGLDVKIDEDLLFEKLIDICELSFSSPTYTVLKTVDEAHLVEQMFANPMFVEDVARQCLNHTLKLGIEGKVSINAKSFESIHKHNAVAEIQRVLRKNKQNSLEAS
ncbi:MAG: GTP cyclohydrolase I FolE2 [Nitrososphaerales archaeon]